MLSGLSEDSFIHDGLNQLLNVLLNGIQLEVKRELNQSNLYIVTLKQYLQRKQIKLKMNWVNLSPIRMRQKYTRVNILRCANFTQGKQMAHANANTLRSIFTYGKFTPGSDQMRILFLHIHTCKFTVLTHVNAK